MGLPESLLHAWQPSDDKARARGATADGPRGLAQPGERSYGRVVNPNREHIDDEVSVDVSASRDFKTWLVGPPRRGKRDLIFAPLAVVIAIGSFVVFSATADTGVLPAGGVVLGGVVLNVAEVLPVRAVRPAMVLRLIGMVLFLAAMVSMLVVPFVG